MVAPGGSSGREISDAAAISAFLPRLLSRSDRSGPLVGEWERSLWGVVLIADISGFTALAEKHARRGAEGAEALARILDRTFGPMVDVIAEHGGDVLRFAGDAPIVLWSAGAGAPAEVRSSLTAQAARCAHALLGTVAGVKGGAELTMSVGIGAGPVVARTLGGTEGRWELVVGGPPLAEMGAAEAASDQGEIVLGPGAARELPARWGWQERDGGRVVLRGAPPSTPPDVDGAGEDPPLRDPDELRSFIPRSLLSRWKAGQEEWLAEYRAVTVLFCSVDVAASGGEQGASLAHAFVELQRAVYDLGGSINQFLVDDKGTVLVALWGVPGRTHEDPARRAVEAGLRMARAGAEIGFEVQVGVTSGRVFHGRRGNRRRAEYGVIGATVNRAARLMSTGMGLLCDAATRDAVGDDVEFEDLPPLVLKGRAAALPVFRALRTGRVRRGDSSSQELVTLGELIGRGVELTRWEGILEALEAGTGGGVLLTGAVGIGKTALLNEMARRAEVAGIRVTTSRCDPLARSRPYAAWAAAVSVFLGLPGGAEDEAKKARERRLLARFDELELDRELAPLLNPILELALPESSTTRQMGRDVRRDAIRDLLGRWLEAGLGEGPSVALVDDGQWLDEASWRLAQDLRARVPRFLIVIAGRRGPDWPPEDRDGEQWQVHEVGRLDSAALLEIARRQLRVARLSRDLEDLLVGRSGGNPLFVEELVRVLETSGALSTEAGLGRVTAELESLTSHGLPETVEGVIATRLDRLEAGDQMILKVASVIGRTFSEAGLLAVHPLDIEPAALADRLVVLGRAGVLVRAEEDGDSDYSFAQLAAREVAYNLLLPAQRRRLHEAVAGWFEREGEARAALLAHHWMEAESYGKGLVYLERAGEEAVRSGAEREAASFYARALRLVEQRKVPEVDALRAVRWRRELGHAWFVLGRMDRSSDQLMSALEELRSPIPGSRSGWIRRLAGQVVVQGLHVVGWSSSRDSEGVARSLEAARLMGLVGQMSFYRDEGLPFVTAALQAINLAERAGHPEAAASGYASLGYVAAVLGLDRLARRFWRRCDEGRDSRARVDGLIGQGLFAFGRCDWEECDRRIDEALSLAARTSDPFSRESALTVRVYRLHHTGQFEASLEAGAMLLSSALDRRSRQREMWGRLSLVGDLLSLDRIAEADEHLAEADQLLADADELSRVNYHALRTRRWLKEEAWKEIEQEVRVLDELSSRISPLSYSAVPVYTAMAESALRLARREGGSDGSSVASARAAIGRLRKSQRTFPYARPAVARLEAEWAELRGWEGRARRHWRAYRQWSRRLGMPESSGTNPANDNFERESPPDPRARRQGDS